MVTLHLQDGSEIVTKDKLGDIESRIVQYIFEHKDSENVPMFCEQLYDLALLSHKPLNPDEMTKFIARSNEILMLLAK